MTRIPRVRLVLVVAALLTLIAVPMAGARTLNAPSVHATGSGWLGAALDWAGGFAGFAHRGHTGSQVPPHRKDDPNANKPQGGGCIDPMGHPRPICF